MKKSIGIIGVGLMGHGIAYNLLRHEHRVVALEHAGNQPMGELLGMGAQTRTSAREVAADSEIVILCVTGTPEVESVLTGAGGVLEGLQPGAVVVDCSTSIPQSSQRMAAAVEARGGRFVDAPMTRTAQHARAGKLNLLVGGDPVAVEQVMPVLRCFAENITAAGDAPGSGHRLKLLHNFVSLGMAAVIAEAAACAQRGGTDPKVFVDVLAAGGGAGVALDRMKPYILDADPSGLQFFIANALKDLSYYVDMASAMPAEHGIAAAVASTFDRAVQAGEARTMVPELVRVLAQPKA